MDLETGVTGDNETERAEIDRRAIRLHTSLLFCVLIIGTLAVFPLIQWLNAVSKWTDIDRKYAVFKSGTLILGIAFIAETVWLFTVKSKRIKWTKRMCIFVLGFNFLFFWIAILSMTLSAQFLVPLCAALACGVVVQATYDAWFGRNGIERLRASACVGTAVYLSSLYLYLFLMKFMDLTWAFAVD